MKRILLAALLGFLARGHATAADSGTARDLACAGWEMALFSRYLDTGPLAGAQELPADCGAAREPDWLPASAAAMSSRAAWKEHNGGALSEARLWQEPALVLKDFAALAQRSFPEQGAKAAAIPSDVEAYGDILSRLDKALDRIRRARRLEGSFEGRGAGLWSGFNRVQEPLDSVYDAVIAGDADAFSSAADKAARAAEGAFALLFEAPRPGAAEPYQPRPRVSPGYRAISLAVSGHQLAFLRKGQRVDVLGVFTAEFTDQKQDTVAATLLQNIRVLDLLKPDRESDLGVVELLVNPREAQYLALLDAQGQILLTARADGDLEMHPMEIASFRKLQ